jgi:hypothetical protein
MAYERNWAFSYNNLYTPTSNLDQTQYQLWALKAMLLGQYGGLSLGLWTTEGSSDSATAGNGDLVDRWGSSYDPSKIVRGSASQPHSWYVLKSPLMNGQTFYMLVTFDDNTDYRASLFMAKAPFTGGTATANPTSTDSWNVGLNQGDWNSNNGSGILNRFNMALSSMGDFAYFPVQSGASGSTHRLAISAVAPANCDPSDPYPIWSYKEEGPGQSFSVLTMFGATAIPSSARSFNSTVSTISVIGNTNNTAQYSNPDVLTGNYPQVPCNVLVSNSSHWHLRGRLPDIRGVPASSDFNIPQSGLVARDNLNNVTHVLVGCLWVPCGSVVPNLV